MIQSLVRVVCLTVFLAYYQVDSSSDQTWSESIHYLVDLSDAKNHYVSVTMTIPMAMTTTRPSESVELMMPVWTPGSYLIREYARHVDSFAAKNSTGEPLAFEKIRKNRWRIAWEGSEKIVVSYRVYANELTVRTNYVGSQFAMLNGAPTFMTIPGRISERHRVQLKLPRGWTKSATSLTKRDDDAHLFYASDYHELVDSPVVAGNVNIYPFEPRGYNGPPMQLVNIGETGYWNGTKAAADLTKIVEAHNDVWCTTYPKNSTYLFLNVICERVGGVEHGNCTLLMTSRWSFRDKKRYRDWLSLASHEFFHRWNVRRLRPKSLMDYDYENEMYTPSLWIAEGITSYYEDLLLVRARLIDRKDYLDRLSKNIQSVQRAEGRLVQSLSESSFDSWIKHYRRNENSSNTTISYYSKGAVVAFLLDAKIRKHSVWNLDKVMQRLYGQYSKTGYSPSDFRNLASEIAGVDLGDWFASTLDSTDELDYSEALDWFGLEFADEAAATVETNELVAPSKSKNNNPNQAAEGKNKLNKPKEKRWLGLRLSDENVVTRVTAYSPATKSGIHTGDEIVGINGYRFTGNLETRLAQYEIGEVIELLISRRGQLIQAPITIEGLAERSWQLRVRKDATDQQKKRIDDWLSSIGCVD